MNPDDDKRIDGVWEEFISNRMSNLRKESGKAETSNDDIGDILRMGTVNDRANEQTTIRNDKNMTGNPRLSSTKLSSSCLSSRKSAFSQVKKNSSLRRHHGHQVRILSVKVVESSDDDVNAAELTTSHLSSETSAAEVETNLTLNSVVTSNLHEVRGDQISTLHRTLLPTLSTPIRDGNAEDRKVIPDRPVCPPSSPLKILESRGSKPLLVLDAIGDEDVNPSSVEESMAKWRKESQSMVSRCSFSEGSEEWR